jgi:ketosteroid isomerase-like protein
MDQIEEGPAAQAERAAAGRVFIEWDRALANGDIERLLACYTEDVVFESPLVRHVLGDVRGILHGREQLRRLFETFLPRKPKLRRHYRPGYFTNGRILMFEYPRESPEGEQMDFVEVMHLRGGKIAKHKVYWGWCGVKVMEEDAYHP